MSERAPEAIVLTDAARLDDGLVDWGGHQLPIDGRSRNRGRLLFKGEDGLPEAGLWRSTPGSWRLLLPADELCFFVAGRAVYRADDGETLQADPGSLIHFKEGWRGRVEVQEEIVVTYMLTAGGPRPVTPMLRHPLETALDDWGEARTLDGRPARMRGVELSREPDGRAESGIWECGPALRPVAIGRDEFCHFLAGSGVYRHEGGQVVPIAPGTIVFFPAGWTGTCETKSVTRKIYMNR